MTLLETKHKRKSAVITAVILALILLGIFNFGMRYLDPPAEYGLAINLGGSNVGNGDPVENTKNTPVKNQPIEKLKEVTETPKEVIKEKVITQEVKDAPIVDTSEKKKEEKPVVKEVPKEKPKPSKETEDALNNLLKGDTKDGKPKNEGDDVDNGVKGKKTGDPKNSKYYGNKGDGGDSNYNLSGRNALSKPIEKPDCNEEGIVVVSIEVDRNGKVIKAVPGVKGTTNTAACLLKPAKEAALRTTWNPDKNAPTKQIGTIIYKFSLSE